MGRFDPPELSRRERELMDIIYERGEASVAEARAGMASPPSYSAVRATLRVLEEKGHLRHREDGPRYVYVPKVPRGRARRSALRRVLHTFFEGDVESTVETLLDIQSSRLTKKEYDRLAKVVAKARRGK